MTRAFITKMAFLCTILALSEQPSEAAAREMGHVLKHAITSVAKNTASGIGKLVRDLLEAGYRGREQVLSKKSSQLQDRANAYKLRKLTARDYPFHSMRDILNDAREFLGKKCIRGTWRIFLGSAGVFAGVPPLAQLILEHNNTLCQTAAGVTSSLGYAGLLLRYPGPTFALTAAGLAGKYAYENRGSILPSTETQDERHGEKWEKALELAGW